MSEPRAVESETPPAPANPAVADERRLRWLRRLLALGVFAATLALLVATNHTVGVTRDEGYYFDAGEKYWVWFAELADNLKRGRLRQSFTKRAIDRGFGYNHEHPILMKVLFGVSWRVLHRCQCPEQRALRPVRYTSRHRSLGWASGITAFRLPAMAAVALMVALVFLFAAEVAGLWVGLVAAGFTLLQPRLFFHAHLACFDAPIAAMWFLVAYGWWRALTSWRWGLVTGVFYGLMLATKHNAWIIPAALGLHWIAVRAQAFSRLGARTFLPPAALLSALVLGPTIFLLHWPWMWVDTAKRFAAYAGFHLHHVHYKFEYFGVNYNKPPFPWHFPFGMTATTAPVVLLALMLLGSAVLLVEWRRRRVQGAFQASNPPSSARAIMGTPAAGLDRRLGLFLGLNVIVAVGTFTTTRTPIFGATKHWLTAMPFLAILAALGLQRIAALALASDLGSGGALGRYRRALLLGTLTLAGLVPAAYETYRSHPYGLSYYNALAGGYAGGADLGMNRQFWGHTPRGLLEWLNATVEPNTSVYFHDLNHESYLAYVRSGLLRRDIRYAGWEEHGIRNSRYAMVMHEKHFGKIEAMIWDHYGTVTPVKVLTRDGVPLVTVYKRPPGLRPRRSPR